MFQGNFYVSEDGQHHNQADLAEIAELKRQLADLQGGCAPYIMLKDATLKMAKTLLLESQAREARLREALIRHEALTRPLDSTVAALALPHDDTALKEYRDAVIEKCAVIAANACLVPPDGGTPTVEEAAVSEEAARRIRKLKGGA